MHIADANALARVVERHNSAINFAYAKNRKWVQASARIFCLVLLAPLVAGCFSALTGPPRLYPVDLELAPIRAYYDDSDMWGRYNSLLGGSLLDPMSKEAYRNDIVTARMYAIDVNYTEYESQLTREGQEVDLTTGVASQGMTIAAGLVGGATAQVLNGAVSGVNYLGTAYNEKVLLKQTIQHIQWGMRQARSDQAAIIIANMQCGAALYPLGLALSDVELYYRAGTFESGLVKVTENVADKTTEAQANKETKKPASPPEAQAKLVGNAVNASIKAGGSMRVAGVTVAAPDNLQKPCTEVGVGPRIGPRIAPRIAPRLAPRSAPSVPPKG